VQDGVHQEYVLIEFNQPEGNDMKNRKMIGSAVLAFGLIAAGTSFADETISPVSTQAQERSGFRIQEQQREMQQNMARHRYEASAQTGQGAQHKHREMYQEQTGSSAMRGNGGARAR
jgi:hypothetical protein